MGTATVPPPVKLIAALMGRDLHTIQSARAMVSERFGRIDSVSEAYSFTFSDYYRDEMGDGLVKQFVSFADLIDPARLANVKLMSNEIEQAMPRPDGLAGRAVNIDPGYLTGAKLILATTKDYSHRIYVGQGIYAEVTLQFRHGAFIPFEWTYPDYRTPMALAYFSQVRTRYLQRR